MLGCLFCACFVEEKMRIAVYHNLPSGGAKRTLYEMVRRLAAKHQVDLFTLSCANHEFADLRPFAHQHNVYDFAPRPLFQSPFGRFNQLLRWADLQRLQKLTQKIGADIDQGGYDVLFVHPCQFEKSPSVLQFVHIPTVYYCQEPLRHLYEAAPYRPYDGGESRRRQWLNKIDPLPKLYYSRLKRTDQQNTRAANRVLVNSRFMQTAVDQIYGVASQVCYHAIDADWFRPQTVAVSERPFIFSVGSLTPMKGFDFLLQAVAQLPAEQLPLVTIASNFQNPPERAYLETLATELGVPLQLLLNISDEQLVRLYNQATVVAYTPHREPFGLVPLEAMACAKPVVAVAEGGVVESVQHEQTGLLAPREPALFAAALARLLDDPALGQAYGRAGRAVVEQRWTWETAVGQIEAQLAAQSRRTAVAVNPISLPNLN